MRLGELRRLTTNAMSEVIIVAQNNVYRERKDYKVLESGRSALT